MSKYIKLFETTAAYEAAESGLILPNVSLTVDDNTVHYNPYVDPYDGHNYVEIGGLKWATMNIGATGVTDTGFYFQWGDTQGYTAAQVGSGQKYFGWADYNYWTADDGSGSSGMTKYNSTDGLTALTSSDDAVVANWGGLWRMPTDAECVALGNAVNTAWTQVDGVYGMLCTDKNDSSKTLFFPAAGYCANGSTHNVGSNGLFWSSSKAVMDTARGFGFDYSGVIWSNSYYRNIGFTVRGVAD